MRACNLTKIAPHRGCFPKNFSKFTEQLFCYLWTVAPVISLHLHRFLHICPIRFHLNHSKSHGWSEGYFISGIFSITLLLLLCFTCKFDIVQTGTTPYSESDYWLKPHNSQTTGWIVAHNSQITRVAKTWWTPKKSNFLFKKTALSYFWL